MENDGVSEGKGFKANGHKSGRKDGRRNDGGSKEV